MNDKFLSFNHVYGGWIKGNAVIRDLDRSFVEPGLVRLIGPNGSGKSTLVELCSGYLKPMSGVVRVMGAPANSRTAINQRTVCRSLISSFPEMTVLDHANLFCALRGVDRNDVMSRLERFGLFPWLREKAKNLSTGSLRKLWIVMCWNPASSIFILDEPFQGLDEASVNQISGDI
jgi:ABC-type multidrug transport system ATPase subunit